MPFNCQADLKYYEWPECLQGVMGDIGYEYIPWNIPNAFSLGFFQCSSYNNLLEDSVQCNNTLSFQNEYNPCPCNGFFQTDGDVSYNIPMWTATPGNFSAGNGYCCEYYESSDDEEPSTCGTPWGGVEGACSCLNGPQGNMCNDSGKVGKQIRPEEPGVRPNNVIPLEQDCYCDPECGTVDGLGDTTRPCCKAWVCDDPCDCGDCGGNACNCVLTDMRDVECVSIDTNVYGCMDWDTPASNIETQPACGNEGFCEDTLLSCTPGGDTSNCGDGAICYYGCPDGCEEGVCPDTSVSEMCDYEGCIYYCLKDDNPFWCQSEESTWRYPYGDGETPWPSGVPCPCPGDAVTYLSLLEQGFTVFTNDELQNTECNLCYDNECTLHSLSQCNPVYQNSFRLYTDADGDGLGCCGEMAYMCVNDPSTSIWKVQDCGEAGASCECPSNEFDQCGICDGSNQCVGCLDPLSCNYKSSYTNDCSGTGNGAPGFDFGGGEFVYYADIIGTMYFNLFNMQFRPDHDPTDETLSNWGARAMSGCGPYGLSSGAITNVWGNRCEIRDFYFGGSNDCGEPGDYNLPYGECDDPDDTGYMSCQEAWESQAGDAFDESWDNVCLSGKLSSVVSEVFTNYSNLTLPDWNWESDWNLDVQACAFYLTYGGVGSDLPINIRHPWLFSQSKATELCTIFALGPSFDNPGNSDPSSFDEFEGLWINYRSINTFHMRKVNYTQIQGTNDTCSSDYSEQNAQCNGLWLGQYGDTSCCEYVSPGSDTYPCDCDANQPLTYYNDTNDWDGYGCSDLSNQFCEGEQPPGWVLDDTGSCEQCPSLCDGQGGGTGSGTESCIDDCGVCNGNNYCNGEMNYEGGTCDGTFVGDNFDCSGECFGDSILDWCQVCDGINFSSSDNCCIDSENPQNCRNKVWITYPPGISSDNAILKPGDYIGVKVHIYSIDNPVHSITTGIESLPGEPFQGGTLPYEDTSPQYIGDGIYQSVQNYYIQDDLIAGPSGTSVVGDWSDVTNWMDTKFRVYVSAKESLYQCGNDYLGNDSQCELPNGDLCTPCNFIGIDFEIEGQTDWHQLYNWWDGNTGQEVGCGNYQYDFSDQNECLMGICANGAPCVSPNSDDVVNCGDQNSFCNPAPCWDGSDCTIGYASFRTNNWSSEFQSFLVDAGPDIEVNESEEGFPIVINYLYQGYEFDESAFRFEWIQTSGVTLSHNDDFDVCNGVPNCRWFNIGVPGVRDFDLIVKDNVGNVLGQTTLKVVIAGQSRTTQLEFRNRLIGSKENNLIDKKLRSHQKVIPVRSSPPVPSINPNIDETFLSCLYQFPDFNFGDVDNSGNIDVTDIVKIISNIDDLTSISECAPFFADVNQDGIVDIFDIMSIADNILNRWNRNTIPPYDITGQVRTLNQYLGCPSKYPQLLTNGEPYINHDWDCWDSDGAAASCDGCYEIPESGWAWVCQDNIDGDVYPNDPNCGNTGCSCIIRPDYVCKLDPNGDTYYPMGDETCDVNGYRNPLCGTDIETPIMELSCVVDGLVVGENSGECNDIGDNCMWSEIPVPVYELQCGALGTDGCEYPGTTCCDGDASNGDPCFYGIYACGEVQTGTTTEGAWAGTCEMVETGVDVTPFECTTQCKTFGLDSNCDNQCPGVHTGNYCIDKLEHCCLHDFPKQWTETFNSYVPDWNGLPDDYEMNFKLLRCDDDSLSTCQNVGDFGPERMLENPSDSLFGEIDIYNVNSIKSPYTIPIISVFGADCVSGDRLIECSRCTNSDDCDIRGILPRFESIPPIGYDTVNFQHIASSATHNEILTRLQVSAGSLFSGYVCNSGPYEGQYCQQHYGVAGTGCGTEFNDTWDGWENQTEECEESGFCSWSCILNPLSQGPPTIYQKLVRGTHYDYGNGILEDGDISMARQLYWDNTTYPAPYPTWDGTSPLYDNVPPSIISNNPYPVILNDGEDGDVDITPVYSLSIKNKVNDDTHEKIYFKLYDPLYEQEYPIGCMKILAGGNYGVDGGINEIKYHIYSDVNVCGGSQHDGLYQGVCSHDTTINCENNIDCRIKVSVTTNGGDAILSPGNCFKHGCTDADGSGALSAGYPNHPNGQPACNYDGEAEVDDGSCIYQTKWYHDFDGDEQTNCDSAFVVQCEQPTDYYQCDCCDSGDCSGDDVCNDPNDYCQSNIIDDCGVCDGPDYCNGTLELDSDIGLYRCICDPGTYPCWTTNNDISSCESSVGFDCRGVCGTGWVTDPCGIGATDNTTEFSISAGFGGNCVPCFDRDGDGDGLDYNKISCRLDFDQDGNPCDDNLGDATCVNTYMCPGYNHIYDVSDECPCPSDSDGTNCYQLADGTYPSDPNDTCQYGYWDSCGHCSSVASDITLYSDCRDGIECFDDQNGHKLDDCGNCMTMTCCDFTSGSCPIGDYTPSYDGSGWRLANGNYIFNNPCADIWGNNYVPGNLSWNVGCVDCGGIYGGDNISDSTGLCESAENSGIKCSEEVHCCLPGAVDNCGVCNSAGILNTEYIFFRDWDRDDIPYAESHDFICVKSETVGGTPSVNGTYVVHGHTPNNPYFDGGLNGGGINVIRYEMCTNPVLDGSNYSCYDDTNWDCPEGLDDDCNGECGGSAIVDECGVCGGDGYTNYYVNLGNIGEGWGAPYQHCTSTEGEPDVSYLGSCMNNSSWTTNTNNNAVLHGCWNPSADNYICNLFPCLPDCENDIQGTVITTLDTPYLCTHLNLLLPNDVELSGYSFGVQINGGVSGDDACDGSEFEGSTCWNNIDYTGTHSSYGQFVRIKIYEIENPGGSQVGEPIEDLQISVDSTTPYNFNTAGDYTCDCGDGSTFECECYEVGKHYKVVALYPDPENGSVSQTLRDMCSEEDTSGCIGYDSKEFLFDSGISGCTDDGSLPSCQTVCDVINNQCIGGPCLSWNDPDGSLTDGVFSGDETCSSFTEGQYCDTTADCQSYGDVSHYQNCFPLRPPTKFGVWEPYGTDAACNYDASVNIQSFCQYKTWLCTDSDGDGYGCIDDREWLCYPQDGYIDCSSGNTESGDSACGCSAQSSQILHHEGELEENFDGFVQWGSWELGQECYGFINGINQPGFGVCTTGPNVGQEIPHHSGNPYSWCPSDINPVSNQPYIEGETIPGFVDNCEICMDPMCAPAGLNSTVPLNDVGNINPHNFIDLYVYGWNNEQWGTGESINPCSIYDTLDQWGNGYVPTNPNWNKSCTGCTDPNSSNYNPNATRPCTGAVGLDGTTLNGTLTEHHDNPNPTCPGRCEFNPTRKCTSDDECLWSSPCNHLFENISYGTCKFGEFQYIDPGNGIPVFEEYLNQYIDPQGPNCCCDVLAATCPDQCSPDYEPGTTTDCMGNQLKNCLFGFNENNQMVDSMYSGLRLTLSGNSTTSETSIVDGEWPQDWPLNVNVGDYIRVGSEVMEITQLDTLWPLTDSVNLSVNRGLFGTDSNASYSNEKAYVEHPSFCNYQCCQPYEIEACMDPDAIDFYCWGYFGFLINDYRLCPEYGRIPNCDIDTYGDLCLNVIDGTSNDNWERTLIKPCGGDNSCCTYQHDCSGQLCNGRECDERTNNSWFDFCGNCITPDSASTEGWANIGCGCNPTLGLEGNEPPVYYLDSDMDGFGCSNLVLTPNVSGELTMMYQQYGLNVGNCVSDPSKKCWKLENPIHSYGECGTGGGDIDDCARLTAEVYNCDDGNGGYIDGTDCAGFNWGWEYCDQPPRWYIKEDTVMGHSGTTEGRTDLWWYDLEEDGLECTVDEDCAIHNPQMWDCWITQGEGCDLMPVQVGACENGHCQHPGWQGAHETIPMCFCYTNDYDCEGNCISPENENPLRFDSCQECGGSSFGCTRNLCKYQGFPICFSNGQPDDEIFVGDGVVCEDYCCTEEGDCTGEHGSYWIYNGERTIIPCVEQLDEQSGFDIPVGDTCNMETGYCNIQTQRPCENHHFCSVEAVEFLWTYSRGAQTNINDEPLGGLKTPDGEPGYHNETFHCDYYHPEWNPTGNPYSKYDCNCDCNGNAYMDDCGVCVGVNGVTGMKENNMTECNLQAGCIYDPDNGQYCESYSVNSTRYASSSYDDRSEGFQNWIDDGFGPDLDCNCDCKPHTLKGKYIRGEVAGVPQDQIIPWYGTAHIDFPMGDRSGMGGSNILVGEGDDITSQCGSEETQPYLCDLSCGCAGGNTFPSYKRIQQAVDTDEDGIVDIIYNEGGLGHKYCFTCFDKDATLGYNPQKYSHCSQFGGNETCYSASPAVGEGYTCSGNGVTCNPTFQDWQHPEGCGTCRQVLSIYAEDVACQNYGCGDKYSLNYQPLSWGGLRCINSWLWNEGNELYQWPQEIDSGFQTNTGTPWYFVDTREPEYAGYTISGTSQPYDYVMGTPQLVETEDSSEQYTWTGDDCDGCSIPLGAVVKGRDWSCQPSAIPEDYIQELYLYEQSGWSESVFQDLFNSYEQLVYPGINYTKIKDGENDTYNPIRGWFYGASSEILGSCGSGGDGAWTEAECNSAFPAELDGGCVSEYQWAEESGHCGEITLECVEMDGTDEIVVEDTGEICEIDGVPGHACGPTSNGICKITEASCNSTDGCHYVTNQQLCDASGHCKWKYPFFGWGQRCHVTQANGKFGLRGVAPMGLVPSCRDIGVPYGRTGSWQNWDDHEVYHWHSMVLGGGTVIQGKYGLTPGGSQFPNLPDSMWKLGIMKKHHDFTFRMQIPPEIMFQGFSDHNEPNITHLAVTFGDTNRYQNMDVVGQNVWVTECDPSDASITVIFDFTGYGEDIFEKLSDEPFTVRAGYEGGSITFNDGDQLITAQVSTCQKNNQTLQEMLEEGIKNAVISVRKHHAKPDVTCTTGIGVSQEALTGTVLDSTCAFHYNGWYNSDDEQQKSSIGVALKPDSSDHHGYATRGTCTEIVTSYDAQQTTCEALSPCNCDGKDNEGVSYCTAGGGQWYNGTECYCRCQYYRSSPTRYVKGDDYDCSLGSWGFTDSDNNTNMAYKGPWSVDSPIYNETYDKYIWFDNFRLQSARKSGMLGMIEVTKFHPLNSKWGEDKRDYCCIPSWCGGWTGDYCEDCVCEDNHSIWNNSFELSFFDDAALCGLTYGNPGNPAACTDAQDLTGMTIVNDGEVDEYNDVLEVFEANHPRHTLWRFTDENETYVDNCGSDGGSSGRNEGHLQNYAWQPGDMIKADNNCDSTPGSTAGGERYGNEGGDYTYGCGKPTTFRLYEFPNMGDPCYDSEQDCITENGQLVLDKDGQAGLDGDSWCVKDVNGDGIYENCWSSQACVGTCTESPYKRWEGVTGYRKPDYLTEEGKEWHEITRRWDYEKDFLDYWNSENYAAAETVVDNYWDDDGYYYFVVKTEGSQGYYTTSDGGEVYDWLSSQVNNLNNCGTWCMGGWKRKSNYYAFPVSKKLVKNTWTSPDPKPQVFVWAEKGSKSNEEVCNEAFYNTENDFDVNKFNCRIFDIPEELQSVKNNGDGGASGDLPGHTSCGGGHDLEWDTDHSWRNFPPNWGTTNESVWKIDKGSSYHIAFSVILWPPSFIHSKGVDWILQPFGDS